MDSAQCEKGILDLTSSVMYVWEDDDNKDDDGTGDADDDTDDTSDLSEPSTPEFGTDEDSMQKKKNTR